MTAAAVIADPDPPARVRGASSTAVLIAADDTAPREVPTPASHLTHGTVCQLEV